MKSSLYSKLPGVSIEAKSLPPKLRSLLPFALRWSYSSDNELERQLKRATAQDLQAFVTACESLQPALEDYVFKKRRQVPIPDEIVVFQIMYQNFLSARSQVAARE